MSGSRVRTHPPFKRIRSTDIPPPLPRREILAYLPDSPGTGGHPMKRWTLAIVLVHAVALSQNSNAVVTGRISRIDGAPARGVRVAAVPAPEPNGPAPAAGSVLASIVQTDSSGVFRLENV